MSKRCPMCAESCQDAAVICPHCRHEFTAEENRQAGVDQARRSLVKVAAILFVIAFVLTSIGGVEGLGRFFASAG